MKRLHFENRMHGETVLADANPFQNDERNTRTQVNRFFFFFFFINDTLQFCSYKALGFPSVDFIRSLSPILNYFVRSFYSHTNSYKYNAVTQCHVDGCLWSLGYLLSPPSLTDTPRKRTLLIRVNQTIVPAISLLKLYILNLPFAETFPILKWTFISRCTERKQPPLNGLYKEKWPL